MNERELERKARVAQLLLDAARSLGETLEPDRVYDRFHDLLADVVAHDGVLVSSYDEGDGLIRCDYAWSDGNRLDTSVFPRALNRDGGGMQSRVIVSGEPLSSTTSPRSFSVRRTSTTSTAREGPEAAGDGPPGSRAAMMVPVKHEARVVGVVQVMSNSAEYSHEQLSSSTVSCSDGGGRRNARLRRSSGGSRPPRRRRARSLPSGAGGERARRRGRRIFLVDRDGIVRLWNAPRRS